jgi:hypothetical protein
MATRSKTLCACNNRAGIEERERVFDLSEFLCVSKMGVASNWNRRFNAHGTCQRRFPTDYVDAIKKYVIIASAKWEPWRCSRDNPVELGESQPWVLGSTWWGSTAVKLLQAQWTFPNNHPLRMQFCKWLHKNHGYYSYLNKFLLTFFLWRCDPTRVIASSFLRFLDHTQRRTTVGRTPLDEWSAHRRDLYLTTHNTHNRQTLHAPNGIRTHEFSRRAAADLRLRPRGHWDRHFCWYTQHILCVRVCAVITSITSVHEIILKLFGRMGIKYAAL